MENKIRRHTHHAFIPNSSSPNPHSLHRDSHTISKQKIRVIHLFAPEIVKTDVENFRELVQKLTGKLPLSPCGGGEDSKFKNNEKKIQPPIMRITTRREKQQQQQQQEPVITRITSSDGGVLKENIDIPGIIMDNNTWSIIKEEEEEEELELGACCSDEISSGGGYLGGFFDDDLEGFISALCGDEFPLFPLDGTHDLQGWI